PGLLFLTPSNFRPPPAAKEAAPIIVNDFGQLVWNGPNTDATNLQVFSYRGHQVLSYWSGVSSAGANVGHGYGNIKFLDTSYNEILTVCPQFGLTTPENIKYPCEADFHEVSITDRNTLIVGAYNATRADLSSVGGPVDGWVFDNLVFELDPQNGAILYRWSALEHVPINETKQPLQGTGRNQSQPFDWFHANSIVELEDGFLINARHTWTIYFFGSDSHIRWRLEGATGGDFGPLPTTGRFVLNGSITLSLFNNYNSAVDNGTHQTTGLELQLLLPAHKSHSPKLLKRLIDPTRPIYADSQGSYQTLPNGNTLMNYGQIPLAREYNPAGDVIWTGQYGPDNLVQGYRGFKQEWHATPAADPSLVVKKGGDGCYIGYVSWNGATDVKAWAIEAGLEECRLDRVGEVRYKGFETSFRLAEPCARVLAVGNGQTLARSNIVCG
ncbi:MAG: hypothetical protein Q9179_002808, partial [Wetmoreana sp. 5 TL-2023]